MIVSFTVFDGDGSYADILQFTGTGSRCCALGDRIPFVQADVNGNFLVGSAIGNDGNKYFLINNIAALIWHPVEISQTKENGQVQFNSNSKSSAFSSIHVFINLKFKISTNMYFF